jgi:Zn-finger nucleic acid-binding protein
MIPNCPMCQATPTVTMLTIEMSYGLCLKCGGVFLFGQDATTKIMSSEHWNSLLPECRLMLRIMSPIQVLIPTFIDVN